MLPTNEKAVIETIHLFPILDKELIGLLRSLTPEEWAHSTIAKKWTVKDIAAHLLDGNIRTLSLSRDQHLLIPPVAIDEYRDLVNYLNDLNAQWVTAMKRVSPGMLTDLDPGATAIFSVAWAGETVSKNWFHIAREYSEKFIHQLQIRHALDKPGLITKELFYPFIDTLMRALPHTFHAMNAPAGTLIKINVSGEAGGNWFLSRKNQGWVLTENNNGSPAAEVSMDPETAWKLFSKGISPAEAEQQVLINGDKLLGKHVLTMVSVMA
jgi:hypothetical protein